MPRPSATDRRGRRGLRTAGMIRIAHERIGDLFVAAETEARRRHLGRANRYVRLARSIGTRYNVRLLSEYREMYCRACSAYWVEGLTVRTRLRGSNRVRACLACGTVRRIPYRGQRPPRGAVEVAPRQMGEEGEGAMLEVPGSEEEVRIDEEEED